MKHMIQLLFVVALFPISYLHAAEKPNIVYILVDNWGWGDISVQGSTVPTPSIDQLASEGLRLTNFNVENQCTPTRSAIHTGRLPIRSGTQKVPHPGEPQGMAPWEYTLPELLKDAGYETALFGKWHLGNTDGRLPNDQGYDQWWGIKETSNQAAYAETPQFDPTIYPIPYIWEGVKGKKSKKVKPFTTKSKRVLDREIVEKSEDYIKNRSRRDAPFFLYVGLTHIHSPYTVHPDFEGKSGSGLHADTKMEIDYNVGRILNAIDRAGIRDNTLVILTGDNGAGKRTSGASLGGDGSSNGPWRGGLSTGYEGGLRTVGMIRWPEHIKQGTVSDEIVASLDWLPTIANLIGEEERIPGDRPIDGINQEDFLLGKQPNSGREHVITYVANRVFAVKWRNFKTHFFTAEGTNAVIEGPYTFPPVYEIKSDPGETYELQGNEGYAYSWVFKPISELLADKAKSMETYPNIKPGQEFMGYPK